VLYTRLQVFTGSLFVYLLTLDYRLWYTYYVSKKLEPTKLERIRQSTLDRLELDRGFKSQTIDELINIVLNERDRYKNSYKRGKK